MLDLFAASVSVKRPKKLAAHFPQGFDCSLGGALGH
jgi:hypothetical protein